MTAVAIAAARAALAAGDAPWVQPLTHGSMRLVLFAPSGRDTQSPHRQDELYIVTRGTAVLVRDDEQLSATAGNALFVAAEVAHHFEAMSPDFETWAIFWGPAGGE